MDIYSFFEEYASAFFFCWFCNRNFPLAYSLTDHIFQVTTKMDQLMRAATTFHFEKRKKKKIKQTN